jgi:class 3 adenylate cyclase
MLEQSNRTFVGSVLFLDIVEYSKKSVAEQIKLKQLFNALLSSALQNVAVNDRIVLDTGDGAAVSFLGNPDEALFVGMALRDAIGAAERNGQGELPVRIGINLGPVRLIKDINGQLNIIGDGINVAQRVMGFADVGQMLVSRSYYEVVSRLSEEYSQLFRYEGSRTDKHVREHEVYAIEKSMGGQTLTAHPAFTQHPVMQSAPGPAPGGPSMAAGASGFRVSARVMVIVPLMITAIVGTAIFLRALKYRSEPTAESVVAPASKPARSAHAGPAPAAEPRSSASSATASGGAAAPASAGALNFVILPWGEVFVDGRSRGVSPPLRKLEVSAGKHTVEIRNGPFPSHKEQIEVRPGEQLRIRHKFE